MLSEEKFNPYRAPEQSEDLSVPGDTGVERDRLWHAGAMVHRVGYVTIAIVMQYLSYATFRLGLDIWELIKIAGESQYDMFIMALAIFVVSVYLAWLAFKDIRSANHITRKSESRLAQAALWAGVFPLGFTIVELIELLETGPVYLKINDAILAIGSLILWYTAAVHRLRKARALPAEDDAKSL